MVLTVFFAYHSYLLNYQVYSLDFELTRPTLQVYRICPSFSENSILNITGTIVNTGERGAYVRANFSTDNVELTEIEAEGIIVPIRDKKSIEWWAYYIEGNGDKINYNIPMNLSEVTVPNFNVYFEAWSDDEDVAFRTEKKFECGYERKDNQYYLKSEYICVVQ